MTPAEFDRLIEKYQQGGASAAEKAVLDAWFESLQNEKKDVAWTDSDAADQLANIRDAISAESDDVRAVPFYSRGWLRAAASVAILVVSLLVWYTTFRNVGTTITSAPGETRKTILSDGTLVWLKPNTTLNFPKVFDGEERTVQLKGEALFEVAKDPAHPFVIQCGSLNARVLGTSFNIKSGGEKIELMVLTGKVELSAAAGANAMVVLPNQKVSYDGSVRLNNALVDVPEKELVIRGTEYDMAFKNASMKTIFERIEHKFNRQVTLENSALNACLFTADFTDQSLHDTLRLLAEVLGFEYVISDSKVTIKGGTCGNP